MPFVTAGWAIESRDEDRRDKSSLDWSINSPDCVARVAYMSARCEGIESIRARVLNFLELIGELIIRFNYIRFDRMREIETC